MMLPGFIFNHDMDFNFMRYCKNLGRLAYMSCLQLFSKVLKSKILYSDCDETQNLSIFDPFAQQSYRSTVHGRPMFITYMFYTDTGFEISQAEGMEKLASPSTDCGQL